MCGVTVDELHLFEFVVFPPSDECAQCRECGEWVRSEQRRARALA